MPISCVALFVFLVPIFFVSLARFALPYPRIFLAVVHGIDEGIRLSGSAVWLSTSAYSHFDAVSSQRTAGAVRLVRGRGPIDSQARRADYFGHWNDFLCNVPFR